MKYDGMPMGMWILFRRSFRNHLVSVLGHTETEAARTTTAAKPEYREIIAKLPEFEKADRFKMNIVNCAMLSAFVLSMKERPSVEKLTEYYTKAMMTGPIRWFCRMMQYYIVASVRNRLGIRWIKIAFVLIVAWPSTASRGFSICPWYS